jgi:polysaccharide pyruvyl transferase WcaK-like protein
MVHIVLWGAWYGSHNIGDQALLLSIVDLLGEALGDVRFTVMTDNPEHVLRCTIGGSCPRCCGG